MSAISDWFRGLVWMRNRKRSYQFAFQTPAGQEVLKDLAKFCRARETTFLPDGRAHCVLEGRREVWLRITNHLGLTEEQLMDIYSGMERPQTDGE